MCGRYTLVLVGGVLVDRFDVEPPPFTIKPRFNIAPTQQLPIITEEKPKQFTLAKWGFLPSWMKKTSGVINARAETIATKPFFKKAFEQRRCLIPADGFF